MQTLTERVRAHYDGPELMARIKAALDAVWPESEPLSVQRLSALDQFHTRGILATTDLASAAGLTSQDAVLDVGCGLGGPARTLAESFGCTVTGIDLSPSFVEAATYLSERCGLADRTRFEVGNALQLPFEDATFDCVFLQHVAMNIVERPALYAEIARVLKPKARLATYDLVATGREVIFPVPWARDASTSFLLSAEQTGRALEDAGLSKVFWRDDTAAALDWFSAQARNPAPPQPNIGLIVGPEFPSIAANLARNLGEGRLGLLSAVFARGS